MIAQSVAEIISRHVKLTVEGIDRMYLNVYVPDLQYERKRPMCRSQPANPIARRASADRQQSTRRRTAVTWAIPGR
jgi:hypothetical protein